MNLAFDLFADPEPEEAPGVTDSNVQNLSLVVETPLSGDEKPTDAVCPSEPDDHHVLAFVAVCRAVGIDHPALIPASVGTILSGDRARTLPGRRAYDRAECARLANLILRGLASDRPKPTPERWREAADAAGGWELCNRLAAQERQQGGFDIADVEHGAPRPSVERINAQVHGLRKAAA